MIVSKDRVLKYSPIYIGISRLFSRKVELSLSYDWFVEANHTNVTMIE